MLRGIWENPAPPRPQIRPPRVSPFEAVESAAFASVKCSPTPTSTSSFGSSELTGTGSGSPQVTAPRRGWVRRDRLVPLERAEAYFSSQDPGRSEERRNSWCRGPASGLALDQRAALLPDLDAAIRLDPVYPIAYRCRAELRFSLGDLRRFDRRFRYARAGRAEVDEVLDRPCEGPDQQGRNGACLAGSRRGCTGSTRTIRKCP